MYVCMYVCISFLHGVLPCLWFRSQVIKVFTKTERNLEAAIKFVTVRADRLVNRVRLMIEACTKWGKDRWSITKKSFPYFKQE